MDWGFIVASGASTPVVDGAGATGGGLLSYSLGRVGEGDMVQDEGQRAER